jgi:hypothetical protein
VEWKQIHVLRRELNRPLAFGTVCLLLGLVAIGSTQASQPVNLRELVSPNDKLAAQDLRFDATAAQLALQYIQSKDATVLQQLEQSPAVGLLLNHARNYDNDVPKNSPQALVLNLLASPSKSPDPTGVCRRSLSFFYAG